MPAPKGQKRMRRSPEVLMKELDLKMQKLEDRIYKKNKETVQTIGAAILKRAKFDFTSMSAQDLADVKNGTAKGIEIVSDIITKAR